MIIVQTGKTTAICPRGYRTLSMFPNWGYADPPPLVKSGYLYMKDAECVEPNEKSYFRFLVFDLNIGRQRWLPFGYRKKIVQNWPNLQGRCGLICKLFFSSWVCFVRSLIFEIWSILYFPFVMTWKKNLEKLWFLFIFGIFFCHI